MIRQIITNPGEAVARLVDLPSRIETEIRSGVQSLREIRDQLEEMRDLPQSLLGEMSAVKDAMRETNKQLEAMNEQMGAVLRLSAPIQRVQERAQERAVKFRSRLGLGDNEPGDEEEEPAAAPAKPAARRRSSPPTS
jgi:methyl-accepting chemotaxis protein